MICSEYRKNIFAEINDKNIVGEGLAPSRYLNGQAHTLTGTGGLSLLEEKMARKKEILLGLTGSVAVYKSCEIARRLKDQGFNVTVIMTAEATRFITPLLMEAVTQNKVYQDLFALPETRSAWHISLAEKADLVLIAPATANIIAKAASGLCDDLLSCTVLSAKAGVIFAPAMNKEMFRKKIVQENINKLKKSGYRFIGPVQGKLVCGEEGMGCLARVERIVNDVVQALK